MCERQGQKENITREWIKKTKCYVELVRKDEERSRREQQAFYSQHARRRGSESPTERREG